MDGSVYFRRTKRQRNLLQILRLPQQQLLINLDARS